VAFFVATAARRGTRATPQTGIFQQPVNRPTYFLPGLTGRLRLRGFSSCAR
jgi:hypothetical protein